MGYPHDYGNPHIDGTYVGISCTRMLNGTLFVGEYPQPLKKIGEAKAPQTTGYPPGKKKHAKSVYETLTGYPPEKKRIIYL